MNDKKLESRIKNLNDRVLNLAFRLSFQRKLSKESQEKLRKIELELS